MKFNNSENEILSFLPNKVFFTLKECCDLKGINYKTVCNKTRLQPNQGRGDIVCGRKMFRRDIVKSWLLKTDFTI